MLSLSKILAVFQARLIFARKRYVLMLGIAAEITSASGAKLDTGSSSQENAVFRAASKGYRSTEKRYLGIGIAITFSLRAIII